MKKTALVLSAAILVVGIVTSLPMESQSQQYQPPRFQSKVLQCQAAGIVDHQTRVRCGVHNLSYTTAAHGIISATITRTSNTAVLNRQQRVFLAAGQEKAANFVFREVRASDQGVRCQCNAWVTATVNPVR